MPSEAGRSFCKAQALRGRRGHGKGRLPNLYALTAPQAPLGVSSARRRCLSSTGPLQIKTTYSASNKEAFATVFEHT
jgi:hypothetical protein